MQACSNIAFLGGSGLPGIDHASHLTWCSVNNLISIGIREQDLLVVKVVEPRHLDEHTDLLVSEDKGASLVSLAWSYPRQSRALLTGLNTGEVIIWTQDGMDSRTTGVRTIDQWFGRQVAVHPEPLLSASWLHPIPVLKWDPKCATQLAHMAGVGLDLLFHDDECQHQDQHHWVRQSQLTFATVTQAGNVHLWWSRMGKVNGGACWDTSGPLSLPAPIASPHPSHQPGHPPPPTAAPNAQAEPQSMVDEDYVPDSQAAAIGGIECTVKTEDATTATAGSNESAAAAAVDIGLELAGASAAAAAAKCEELPTEHAGRAASEQIPAANAAQATSVVAAIPATAAGHVGVDSAAATITEAGTVSTASTPDQIIAVAVSTSMGCGVTVALVRASRPGTVCLYTVTGQPQAQTATPHVSPLPHTSASPLAASSSQHQTQPHAVLSHQIHLPGLNPTCRQLCWDVLSTGTKLFVSVTCDSQCSSRSADSGSSHHNSTPSGSAHADADFNPALGSSSGSQKHSVEQHVMVYSCWQERPKPAQPSPESTGSPSDPITLDSGGNEGEVPIVPQIQDPEWQLLHRRQIQNMSLAAGCFGSYAAVGSRIQVEGLHSDLVLSYDGSQVAVTLLGRGGTVVLDAHTLGSLQEFGADGTSFVCHGAGNLVAAAAAEVTGAATGAAVPSDQGEAAAMDIEILEAGEDAVSGLVPSRTLHPSHQQEVLQILELDTGYSLHPLQKGSLASPASRSLACFSGNTCVLCQVVIHESGSNFSAMGHTFAQASPSPLQLHLHTLIDLPNDKPTATTSEAALAAATAAASIAAAEAPQAATALSAAAVAAVLAAAGAAAGAAPAAAALVKSPTAAAPLGVTSDTAAAQNVPLRSTTSPSVEEDAASAPGAVLGAVASSGTEPDAPLARMLTGSIGQEEEQRLQMMTTADACRIAWALHLGNSTWDVNCRMQVLSDCTGGDSMARSFALLDQMLENTLHDAKPDWAMPLDRLKIELLGSSQDPSAHAVSIDACIRTRMIMIYTFLELPRHIIHKDAVSTKRYQLDAQTIAIFSARLLMLTLSCIKAWMVLRASDDPKVQDMSAGFPCVRLLSDLQTFNRISIALQQTLSGSTATILLKQQQQHSAGHLSLPWIPALADKEGCKAGAAALMELCGLAPQKRVPSVVLSKTSEVHHKLYRGRFKLHYARPCPPFTLASVAAMLQLPCMAAVPVLPLEQLLEACAAMGLGLGSTEGVWREAVLCQAQGFRLPSPTLDAPLLFGTEISSEAGEEVREWKRQRLDALGLQPFGPSKQLHLAGPVHDCLTSRLINPSQDWAIESVDGRWVTGEYGGSTNRSCGDCEDTPTGSPSEPLPVMPTIAAWLRTAWASSAPMTGARWRRIKHQPYHDPDL